MCVENKCNFLILLENVKLKLFQTLSIEAAYNKNSVCKKLQAGHKYASKNN